MICKICGCEMKNNGDWFACPTCGSVHFGPDPDENKSTEKPPVKKEAPVPQVKKEPVKKAEPFFDFDKAFSKKEEPSVEPTKKPVIKEEPTVEVEKTPVEKREPITEAVRPDADTTPEQNEKQDVSEQNGVDITRTFDETSVKSDSFTLDKDAFSDNFSSFLDSIEDSEEEAPPRRRKNKKAEEADDKKKKLAIKDIVDFMFPIVAAIVIAFVLKTFIIANAKVPTGSMVATINIDDRIIASRLAYRTDTPQRYNIVLFYYPDDENDIFVKRVLGLPGETLEIIDGVVYITTKDGKTIQTDQSFVNPAEAPSGDYGPYYIPEKGETITVSGVYCYAENGMVLGHSEFVDKYCVKDDRGNYVIAENLYFMLGDNRNYSRDSREWNFPYVAENKIIGKVLFRYYPFDSIGKIE